MSMLGIQRPPGLHHCKQCSLNFDSEMSLQVHLQYHPESLNKMWAPHLKPDDQTKNDNSVLAERDFNKPFSFTDSEGTKQNKEMKQDEHSIERKLESPNVQKDPFNNENRSRQANHGFGSMYNFNARHPHPPVQQNQQFPGFMPNPSFNPGPYQPMPTMFNKGAAPDGYFPGRPAPPPYPNGPELPGSVSEPFQQSLYPQFPKNERNTMGDSISLESFFNNSYENELKPISCSNEETTLDSSASDIFDLDTNRVVNQGKEGEFSTGNEQQSSLYQMQSIKSEASRNGMAPTPPSPSIPNPVSMPMPPNMDRFMPNQNAPVNGQSFNPYVRSNPHPINPNGPNFREFRPQQPFSETNGPMYNNTIPRPNFPPMMPSQPVTKAPSYPYGPLSPHGVPPHQNPMGMAPRPQNGLPSGPHSQPANMPYQPLPEQNSLPTSPCNSPTQGSQSSSKSDEDKRARPYSCELCQKFFIRKGHLNRHLTTTAHKNLLEQKMKEGGAINDDKSMDKGNKSDHHKFGGSPNVPPSPHAQMTSPHSINTPPGMLHNPSSPLPEQMRFPPNSGQVPPHHPMNPQLPVNFDNRMPPFNNAQGIPQDNFRINQIHRTEPSISPKVPSLDNPFANGQVPPHNMPPIAQGPYYSNPTHQKSPSVMPSGENAFFRQNPSPAWYKKPEVENLDSNSMKSSVPCQEAASVDGSTIMKPTSAPTVVPDAHIKSEPVSGIKSESTPFSQEFMTPIPSPRQNVNRNVPLSQKSPMPSPHHPSQTTPLPSPHNPNPSPSPHNPILINSASSPHNSNLSNPLPSPHNPGLTNPLPSPQNPGVSNPLPSPHNPNLANPIPSPHNPSLVNPLPSTHNPPLANPLPSPHNPSLVNPLPSPHNPSLVNPLPSPHNPGLVNPLPSPHNTGLSNPLPSPHNSGLGKPLPSPHNLGLANPLPSPHNTSFSSCRSITPNSVTIAQKDLSNFDNRESISTEDESGKPDENNKEVTLKSSGTADISGDFGESEFRSLTDSTIGQNSSERPDSHDSGLPVSPASSLLNMQPTDRSSLKPDSPIDSLTKQEQLSPEKTLEMSSSGAENVVPTSVESPKEFHALMSETQPIPVTSQPNPMFQERTDFEPQTSKANHLSSFPPYPATSIPNNSMPPQNHQYPLYPPYSTPGNPMIPSNNGPVGPQHFPPQHMPHMPPGMPPPRFMPNQQGPFYNHHMPSNNHQPVNSLMQMENMIHNSSVPGRPNIGPPPPGAPRPSGMMNPYGNYPLPNGNHQLPGQFPSGPYPQGFPPQPFLPDQHKNLAPSPLSGSPSPSEMRKRHLSDDSLDFEDGSDKKYIKCDLCGKRVNNDSYEEHMANHKEGKNYPCSLCDKSFNHKTDLRRHMCLHTGERPYNCDMCEKSFIRKDHMQKHRETHIRAATRNGMPLDVFQPGT